MALGKRKTHTPRPARATRAARSRRRRPRHQEDEPLIEKRNRCPFCTRQWSTSKKEPAIQPSNTRAAIYSRVSTFVQRAKGYGLAAQDEDCDRAVERLGVTVVHRWEDGDSGADWELPGLNEMLDAAKRGDFQVLIVPEPDRLARNMAKQLILEEELRRFGIAIHYARFNLEDTSEGRLLKNQLAAFAEYEREKIAFRTARGKRLKAESGKVVGTGFAPYGYRFVYDSRGKVAGLEPEPETAAIVRRIFADIIHMSAISVCRALNAEGIATPVSSRPGGSRATIGGANWQGKPRKHAAPSGLWHPSTIYTNIIGDPIYTGIARFGRYNTKRQRANPSGVIEIPVPALVSPDEAHAAREAVQRRKRQRAARNPAHATAYTLRGMLVCHECNGTLVCSVNGRKRTRYYKRTRRNPATTEMPCSLAVPSAEIDALAWETVSSALLNRDNLMTGLAASRAAHAAAAAQRHERLAVVDAEVAKLRRRLTSITTERLDADPGSESERALRQVATATETNIAKLFAERDDLEGQSLPGLSDDELTALERFAEEIADGIQVADRTDHRRIFDLLRLRGRVRFDPDGVQLGRRRYAIEWQAVIDLSVGHKNDYFLK